MKRMKMMSTRKKNKKRIMRKLMMWKNMKTVKRKRRRKMSLATQTRKRKVVHLDE